MSLQIEKLASPDAFDELRPEWEQIESGISPRTPFTSPLWNKLWWQHLSRDGIAQHDIFYAHAVRDRTRLIAVAPLMITVAPAFGPWRTRRLQYLGADPNITEVHGLVCRAEDEERVVAGLSDYLSQQEGAWDWLRWAGIRSAGAAQVWLEKQGRTHWEEPVLNYWLSLPASWAEFLAGRRRNIKESLRKCYNSLRRAGHSFKFLVIAEPDLARAALDRFLALHTARAVADMSVRHADNFADEQAREFLLEYCESMAQRGQLRVFELEIEGVVVASRVGFTLGRELYLYYSGFAPEWGRFSIMTTLVAEILKWAIEQGFVIANLSVGRDNSKLRWSPEETVFNQGVQQCRGWRSRLSFRLYAWVEGI